MHNVMGYLMTTMLVVLILCLVGLVCGMGLQMWMDYKDWRKRQ